MKKIFAIALALVMVLSMASAFAANDCSTFDWTCPAKATACGKAKVEVVPFVVVNTACGWEYQVSTCATAIRTQEVFFAVKLTVDANVDEAWWNEAELSFDFSKEVEVADAAEKAGFAKTFSMASFNPYYDAKAGKDLKKSEEQVWYMDTISAAEIGWVYAGNKDFDLQDVVFTANVGEKAKDVKVCATLASDHSGFDVEWKVGDYYVYATNTDAKNGDIHFWNDCGNHVDMTWENGKVKNIYASSEAFKNEVFAKFNLVGCGFGTCIDSDIIQKNLGWDDKFESCFSWSDKGASVVNPECVVTLPKTGDASLLWWLF